MLMSISLQAFTGTLKAFNTICNQLVNKNGNVHEHPEESQELFDFASHQLSTYPVPEPISATLRLGFCIGMEG